MGIRNSPTITAKFLAANRANAQRSTGPRSFEGKFRSRWNALRTGDYSASYQRLFWAFIDCAPGTVRETAAAILTPEELSNPFFAKQIDIFCDIQEMAHPHLRQRREKGGKIAKTKP
jgi:hypothetical protein